MSYDSPDAFEGFKKWHHTSFWYLGDVQGESRFGFLTHDTSMIKMMEKTYMDVRITLSRALLSTNQPIYSLLCFSHLQLWA